MDGPTKRADVLACVCTNITMLQFIYLVLLWLVTNAAICGYTHMLTPAVYMVSR